jgi:hypothetical protein
MVINLKTAKALGISVPPELLATCRAQNGCPWLSMGFVVDNRWLWPLCYDRHSSGGRVVRFLVWRQAHIALDPCRFESRQRNARHRPRCGTRPGCRRLCVLAPYRDVGSIKSLRSVRSRARVRSSSALVRRLYPTTSAARIAASLRVSSIPSDTLALPTSPKTTVNSTKKAIRPLSS